MPIYRDIRDGEDGMIVSCDCGCGDTVKLEFDVDDPFGGPDFFFMSYYNSNWYRDQHGAFDAFREKIRKIWRIIRNKDHHYSDIRMSREEFEEFRKYVNSIPVGEKKEDLA